MAGFYQDPEKHFLLSLKTDTGYHGPPLSCHARDEELRLLRASEIRNASGSEGHSEKY